MADPRHNDPRDADLPPLPGHPDAPLSYRDPAADPRLATYEAPRSGGRSGLIAAGIIAALLVIALIAFSTGPATDPGTTAVIPEQQGEEFAPPAMDEAPAAVPEAEVDPAAPAPADEAPADMQ